MCCATGAVSTLKGGTVGLSEDLQTLVRDADAYFSQNDWDLALETYQKVMQVEPQNDVACSKIAKIFAIRGLISDVITQYFNLLQILQERGEFDQALEIARWVMQLQPENDKARLAQIEILRKRGQTADVIRQSLQLARLYIELGHGDESIDLLKKAQEDDPENLDIGTELAEIYISHGHIQEGVTQFRRIATLFVQKEQLDKAADAYKRMKVIQSDDPGLLFTLGELYFKLGRLNEAEAEFRAILRHDLNHVEALLALGNVCHQKGQFRDAILAFNKIITINPDQHVAKEKLGELYHAQGNVNEAIKQYLLAAQAYQEIEEPRDAIKLYQRVVSLDPTHPTACRELTNMGAPMEPEDPRDLGPGYQPPPPAPEPTSGEGDARGDSAADGDRKGGGARARAKSEFAAGSSLVPREASAAAAGGKSMLPRAGLMSARSGGGGLVAKGDGMVDPGGGKRRLGGGGGGGDKPSMARSRASEVSGDSRPALGRRAAPQEPESEVRHEAEEEPEAQSPVAVEEQQPSVEPQSEPPVQAESEESEGLASVSETPPSFAAPVVADEPQTSLAEEAYAPTDVSTDFAAAGDVAVEWGTQTQDEAAPVGDVEAQDTGTGPSLDAYDDTMFPNLETPTGREEPEAPPLQVAMTEPSGETSSEAPTSSVSSRAPLQPRLLGRASARPTSGGKAARPLLGGAGARGKGDSSKPTLPVRGAREASEPSTSEESVLLPVASGVGQVSSATVADPMPVEPFEASASEGGGEAPPPLAETSPTSFVEEEPVPHATAEDAAIPEALASQGDASHEPQPVLTPTEEVQPPASADVGLHAATPATVFQARPFDGASALEELSKGLPSFSFEEGGEAHSEHFETVLHAGDLGRAVSALRHRVSLAPSEVALRGQLADLMFACGRVEEACSEYLQLARLDPENVEVLYRIADAYLWSDEPARAVDLLLTISFVHRQIGDPERALRALQDALTVDGSSTRVRLELVEMYRQSEQDDLVRWHLRQLAQVADGSEDAAASVEVWRKTFETTGADDDQERLAQAFERCGRSDEAVSAYRAVADRAAKRGDAERAARCYERVVEAVPEDAEAREALLAAYQRSADPTRVLDKMRALASVCRQAGDHDTALRLCEEIVQRMPESALDRQQLVESYLDKGLINNARNEMQALVESWSRENRFDVAIPLLRRMVEALPDENLQREQLIHFCERAGDLQGALDELIGFARFQAQRGALDEAMKLYQRALTINGHLAQVHLEMGLLYADVLSDPASAEAHLKQVLAIDPAHRGALERLVALQLSLDKAQEAVPLLTALVNLDPAHEAMREGLIAEYLRRTEAQPDDMRIKFTLGLLYRSSGQIDQAIVLFQDTRVAHELFLHSCNMLGQCFWERRSAGPASAATEEVAIKWFKRGIEAKGYPEDDYLDLRYNLAEVYHQRNETTEALKLYQDIQAVDVRYKDVTEKIRQLEDEINGRNGRLQTS